MIDFLLKNGDAWAGEMSQGVETLAFDSHNPQVTWQKSIYYCHVGANASPAHTK